MTMRETASKRHAATKQDAENPADALLARARQIERERELLLAIAAAANAPCELDDILLLVRSGFLELSGFDRASIWIVENDMACGTWGTDEHGSLRDEHTYRYPHVVPARESAKTDDAGRPYFIREQNVVYTADVHTPSVSQKSEQTGVRLWARGELIGMIFADNLLSDRPIHELEIERLLPFVEQSALAIANARLLLERERLMKQQKHLLEAATAINASLSLDEILQRVRDVVVEIGIFDRAGVFTVEGSLIRGAWGTDWQGQRTAEHHVRGSRAEWAEFIQPLEDSPGRYVIVRGSYEAQAEAAHPIDKAAIALRAGGEMVGMLFVDNAITLRPLHEKDVELLLGLTEQAAAAIRNIRLIAELQQAQDALIRSEKLRAVGELASGVAHNVNNVLAAVLGYAELIQDTPGIPAEVGEFARTIERAAMDGAEIVRRVQSFARRENEAQTASFDLSDITRQAIDLTRPAWHNQALSRGVKIFIEPFIGKDIPVHGVASEIREVLVNLIRNSVDAMPSGGTLTVRCNKASGQAVVVIADTGMGMDEATRKRVFEPFFTTKSAGLGTGLGLAVAWGILDRHRGRIEVESQVGRGSIFRVRLPLEETPVQAEDELSAPQSLEGRRILLVEDEEFVLHSLARTLLLRGASIEMTESAEEALQWLTVHANSCDIVLSDHGMVGMTGLQLLAQIRDYYPQIRRVLISGWGASPPGDVKTDSAEVILTKPVRAEELTAALSPLVRRE